MAAPKRKVDRRIQRTRQVLQQAFKEIVHEKGEAVMGIWGIDGTGGRCTCSFR
jgi:hypothetical protein